MRIRSGIGIAVLQAAALAQSVDFTPRRTRDYAERSAQGYCDIRVWVDDEVNIYLRGDRVQFENVRGQTARDAGSECSQPLPRGPTLSGFNFQGIDGRGRVELIESPDRRNNFRAWVRIQDPKSGGEEHHFRLSWSSGGNIGGSGGYVGGAGGGVGGQDFGGEGLISTSRGRGYIRLGNASDMEISEAIVDLRRNGEAVLELRGEVNFQLAGRWSRDRGDSYRLEIRDGFNRSGASAEGFVYGRGRRLERLEINGTANRSRNRFRISFDADR